MKAGRKGAAPGSGEQEARYKVAHLREGICFAGQEEGLGFLP